MVELHPENYYCYTELVEKRYQTIHTNEINNDNIDLHWRAIVNILNDTIDDEISSNMVVHIVFPDDEIDLYIFQYLFNLMFWTLICASDTRIMSYHLFFEEVINQRTITDYINKFFVKKNIKIMELIKLNQNIDRCIGKFRDLENFQMYLCNTLSFKDFTDLMKESPEFADTIHTDISNIPMEDIKEYGMENTRKQIKYITKRDRDNSLKYSFISGEGTNIRQFKEVFTNIGSMPNGQGSVFKHPIPNSFINGGLKDIEDFVIDSSIGRIAQILQKQNVGQSGAFSRKLGLNNQGSRLHDDPTFVCDSKNFEVVTIKNKDYLKIYNMRYYRFTENGMEYLLDMDKDDELIGKTLLFRSPMTCASYARGHGICYRCYGDLAYVNKNINIGQLAAELLSAIYIQILLSAKHQLESAIIKMNWPEEFYYLFNVEFDIISLKGEDEMDYKKYKLIIDAADINEEENDNDGDDEGENEFLNSDMEESYFINKFYVKKPDGSVIEISTENNDPIYLHNNLVNAINLNMDEYEDDEEFEQIEVDMEKMDGPLFIVNVRNNELSATMKRVKNLIDNKNTIKLYDRNSILAEFIDANLQSNIKLNAVHFEVLLSNQLRDKDDILESPDWSIKNPKYQLITLDNSLSNNPSITIRLQSTKFKRALNHPANSKLYRHSDMDLYTMVHPQEFMSGDYKSGLTEEEQDKPIIDPLVWVGPEHRKGDK